MRRLPPRKVLQGRYCFWLNLTTAQSRQFANRVMNEGFESNDRNDSTPNLD